MKKTITKNDGSTEIVEGTPEEIADYERKIRGEVKESPKNDGPGLLTDQIDRKTKMVQDQIEEGVRLLKELVDSGKLDAARRARWLTTQPIELPRVTYRPLRHSEHCQMTVAQRGWMSVVPPRCDCGAEPNMQPAEQIGTWCCH